MNNRLLSLLSLILVILLDSCAGDVTIQPVTPAPNPVSSLPPTVPPSATIGSSVQESVSIDSIRFTPLSMADLGFETVIPAGWPRIEGDPLLPAAFGPGASTFIAFYTSAGADVRNAMAEMLDISPEQLDLETLEGAYEERQIGSRLWATYATENTAVPLVQTVSMTAGGGKIYIVTLFINPAQKDAVLYPVLESFLLSSMPNEAESLSEPEEQPGLTDQTWRVTANRDHIGQLLPIANGSEVTVTFAEDGTLFGSAGCNEYRGRYKISEETVTLSIESITREDCHIPELMLQETSFLSNLTTAGTYTVKESELQIINKDGENTISLLIN